MIAALILAFLVAGFADRLRGDDYDLSPWRKAGDSAVYGLAVAVCLAPSTWWTYPVFIALWIAGASIGWGEPMGAALEGRSMERDRLEWWQFGFFARNAWAALALRGVIWGGCTLPLAVFDRRFLFALAMTGVMPLAAWIGKATGPKRSWVVQECVRGWLIAAVALAVRFFLEGGT
jgi:hypothetical protein